MNQKCRNIVHAFSVALTIIGGSLAGCHHKDVAPDKESEVIVEVGDTALTLLDVKRRIPSGLSETDSVALFNSIVDAWIERLLLEQLGSENIDDMSEIDRMVENYRRKLIVASYRRNLREAHRWSVSEDSIRRYYRLHASELVLERPVLKGLYVKIPSDAQHLSDVRRWIQTATPDAIDNLEKYGLREAIKYSFFEDTWTDWNMISGEIPYRFEDPDLFLKKRQNFETSYGGITYLLHISGWLPSGTEMPYEVAAPVIAGMLERESGEKYENDLIRGLYARARKDGLLRDYRK